MVDELAGWQARLPARSRYGIFGALRQTLGAAARWGHMSSNPAKLLGPNRQPPPRSIRAYTIAELDAIAAELSRPYRQLPAFAAATGLRPEEWAPLEWRDVDRRAGIVNVRRTVSDGDVVELGKTSRAADRCRSRRRALAALEELPRRLDVPCYGRDPRGGLLRLDNFRRREWSVAIKASGVATAGAHLRPALDVRLERARAGVTVFELARVMGTSVAMIERHYGALLEGAHAGIAGRLDALESELEKALEAEEG